MIPLEQLQDFCSKYTVILSLTQNVLCMYYAQLLQGSLESRAFVTSPQAPRQREYEKTQTGPNPGESRQTEKIRQVVNLLEGTTSQDRFVHPACCLKSTFV